MTGHAIKTRYKVERIETTKGTEWHVYQCQGYEFSIAKAQNEEQAERIVEAMNAHNHG